MDKKSVVIAGGSGFLGVSLAVHLANPHYNVTLLSRHRPQVSGDWEFVEWDGRTLGEWCQVLERADAVVNLAGRSVDCVKSPGHCDEILRSRIESTRVLGHAMKAATKRPRVWVQMSTAHIYGDPPSSICTESSPFGYGLAPHVAKAWEAEFSSGLQADQRGVVLRTSFVIGKNRGAGAGAMTRLRTVARLGLGGRVGSGQQGISWIHENDMNRIFERAIRDSSMQGAYIASSPEPVAQLEFMRSLRRALRIPIGLPASEAMVRLGAHWILRTDPELALFGRYVVPQRLNELGFEFNYPKLDSALQDIA